VRRLSFFVFPFWLVLLAGCATVQFLDLPRRHGPFREVSEAGKLTDYAGIFHVHSRFSHDSKGRFDEIAAAAKKAGADFVIVTDHNTLEGKRQKMEGFYGPTLILIGDELSTGAGHLCVLGLDEEIDPSKPPREIIEEVNRRGGLSFIAHGESVRAPWTDWSIGPVTGMEIYNLAADVYQDRRIFVGPQVLFFPPRLFYRSILDRPGRFLVRWDSLLRERRTVGIGAVDAHQKVRILSRPVDRYGTMFRVVQTHVWAPGLSEKDVLAALQKGHAYVSFDIVAPVKNFMFLAESRGRQAVMGDEIRAAEDLKLRVFLPRTGRVQIWKDGRLWVEKKTDALAMPAAGPGVYRVEVYRRKRLWIVSNPIYVTP
jgi:hypothetical protein